MSAGYIGSTCPWQAAPGLCDVKSGLRCSEVGSCPNQEESRSCEWAASRPVPTPEPASRSARGGPHLLDTFKRRREDARTRVEEAEAKSAELANVLLIVGIALAVAIPLFEVVYGTVTGSAAPFGWRLMALPGGVITLAKMLSLKGKGGGPPGGVPA